MTREQILKITIARALRLIKFCEIGVPDYVIGSEAALIQRGVMALGVESCKPVVHRLHAEAKRGLNLCAESGCYQPITADGGEFGVESCVEHAAEHNAAIKAALGQEDGDLQ